MRPTPSSSEGCSSRSSVVPSSTRYGSNGLPVSSRRSDVSSMSTSSFSGSTSTSTYAPRSRQRESIGWRCARCGAYMEHKWWSCSACGMVKDSS
jgi:hypothetical protein